MKVDRNIAQTDNLTVIIEPETNTKNLTGLNKDSRFLRLSKPIDVLIQNGMTNNDFAWLLTQAVKG